MARHLIPKKFKEKLSIWLYGSECITWTNEFWHKGDECIPTAFENDKVEELANVKIAGSASSTQELIAIENAFSFTR